MRILVVSLLLASASACAGPGQKALSETPTATTKRTPAEAPPASDFDKDRSKMIQSNDDMKDAQNAHQEAAGGGAETPPNRAPGATPTPPTSTKAKPSPTPASPDKAPVAPDHR